jgi:hydroxymethylbilane synthase
MSKVIRIGTRGSQLALWQAHHVAGLLREQGHAVEVEIIRTTGDRMQDPAYATAQVNTAHVNTAQEGLSPNGTGIFIKEIEQALAAGQIDLAVHSLKDLPTEVDAQFALAAIPPRADARDAFVCEKAWGLHMLPSGSRIGTTSPRRQAMLLALRPDVSFVETRGNIDTRLRKWSEGACDALVLACAGLDRLDRAESVHQRFNVDEMTPAPGQGALALEVRASSAGAAAHDGEAALWLAARALNCAATEFATQAERCVLHALGGGCQLPLGAYCHRVDEQWHMHAMVAAPDGEATAHVIERAPAGVAAEEFGTRVAEKLKALGALELLAMPA